MPGVLFVHAHPDDESILTGGTIARLREAQVPVTILTATRGEGGEVIGPLKDTLEGHRDALAAHREGELAEAMKALGVDDWAFLGTPAGGAGTLPERRFEDSGMEWGPDGHAQVPADTPAESLCAAKLDDVAAYIAAVIEDRRPRLVVTYPAGGGYGHPDHVRVHEATLRAVSRLKRKHRPRVIYVDTPQEAVDQMFNVDLPGFALTGFEPAQKVPTIPAEAPVVLSQDISAHRGHKARAMAAHATQLQVAGDFYALSNNIGTVLLDTEYFTSPDGHKGADILEFLEAPDRPEPPSAVAMVFSSVFLGLLAGVLGTFQHLGASLFNLAGQAVIVPWGLLLALALAGCVLWYVAEANRSTAAVVLCAVTMSLVSFIGSQPGLLPGGGVLVTGTLRSVAWLFGPMIIAAVLSFTLPCLRANRKH